MYNFDREIYSVRGVQVVRFQTLLSWRVYTCLRKQCLPYALLKHTLQALPVVPLICSIEAHTAGSTSSASHMLYWSTHRRLYQYSASHMLYWSAHCRLYQQCLSYSRREWINLIIDKKYFEKEMHFRSKSIWDSMENVVQYFSLYVFLILSTYNLWWLFTYNTDALETFLPASRPLEVNVC